MHIDRIVRGVLIVVALALFAGLGAAPASAKTKWICTHFVPKTSGFYKYMTPPFTDAVKQITRGEVEIDCKAVGVIAPGFKGFDAVMEGLADAHHTTSLYIVNKHPANSFYANHPGGMPVEAFFMWWYDPKGGGKDFVKAHHRATMGLHTWGQGVPPQEVWLSHTPITKPADLKNKKFCTAGVWAQIVTEKFGGAGTSVPGSEVYVMMERKALDIMEWSGPSENMNKGLYETAKYVIQPGFHWTGGLGHFSVKKGVWDGLPEKTRKDIMMASRLANFDSYMMWHWADLPAQKKIKARGKNVFLRMDKSLMDAMAKAAREWAYEKAAERSKKGDHWLKQVADSYYAFYDDWRANSDWKSPLLR